MTTYLVEVEYKENYNEFITVDANDIEGAEQEAIAYVKDFTSDQATDIEIISVKSVADTEPVKAG